MAAWAELLNRLERTLHHDKRLHVESIYRAQPLPGWLAGPWAAVQHNSAAEDLIPALCINVKGRQAADALCIVKLSDLERLAGPDTYEMLGDVEIGEAAIFDWEHNNQRG